jgi:hypothetical protein
MGVRIDPEAVYTEFEIRQLGLATEADLKRARKRGDLKFRDLGRGHRTYLGSWLLAWFTGEESASSPRQVQP